MRFNQWLDTFVEEKQINTEHLFEVNGQSGVNIIPVSAVIEAIKGAPGHEREQIKTTLVKIDFVNASVVDYLEHLAKAIAV